jgi:2'-5' RNA ligase
VPGRRRTWVPMEQHHCGPRTATARQQTQTAGLDHGLLKPLEHGSHRSQNIGSVGPPGEPTPAVQYFPYAWRVAQSVELTLDSAAEAALVAQWDRLAAAGLTRPKRPEPYGHHLPHVTLYASDAIPEAAEPVLPEIVAGIDLTVRIGALMIFGPRNGECILVRQVPASVELLQLQQQVAVACEADPAGQFGRGHWSPHVTLARRLPSDQVGKAVRVLGSRGEVQATIERCRRWDGRRRIAWWLS